MVFEQAGVFAIFTLNGIIIGLLFDFFRIIRKSFKITDVGTYMQDISFWILAGIIFLYSMCRFCNEELRWYMIFGVLIGGGIYIITISRYIVSFSVKFVNISKKIFIIIFYPFNLLFKLTKKIIIRPFKKIFNKLLEKTKKFVKKMKQKRGFLRKKENNII